MNDTYTTIGAVLAMVLAMAYLLVREPAVSPQTVAFVAVASLVIGALLPETLVWWMVRHGWLDEATVAGMPRRLWGLLALVCGLAGAALVQGIIHAAKTRLRKL